MEDEIKACLSCELPYCNESLKGCVYYKEPVQIERRRASVKKYYAENTDKVKARKAAWQAANMERVLAYQRERYRKKALERYHANKPPSRAERRRLTLEMINA